MFIHFRCLLIVALFAVPWSITARSAQEAPQSKDDQSVEKQKPKPQSESNLKRKSEPQEKTEPNPKKKPNPKENPEEKPNPEEEPEPKEKPEPKAPKPQPTIVKSARTLNPQWVSSMKWRSIGPTSMGGRVVDLEVLPSDPCTFYIGTASGGIFKTVNNGTTFEPLFQHENTSSIGDIAIASSNPNIVWVGTGEHNARNSVSWGDGVYKSTDAGKTWKHMGLEKSFQIGRIVIHPTNPDIVYVGALGRLWGENEERGLFKSIDGGKSWEKVLWVDAKTGCIDIALSPQDPDTILAAMYERQRGPFDTNDPAKRWGPGGGLYKSTDGGRTWSKLTGGLPTVKLGRIGICYSLSKPGHVFCTIETEKIGTAPKGAKLPALMGVRPGGATEEGVRIDQVTNKGPAHQAGIKQGDVLLEMDGKPVKSPGDLGKIVGAHFADDEVPVKVKRGEETLDLKLKFGRRGRGGGRPFGTFLGGQNANAQENQGPDGFQTGGVFKSTDGGESWSRINSLNPRPFYYSQIRVDPSDENFVYVLGVNFHHSEDGGKTFKSDSGRGVHPDHHAMWVDPKDGRHLILGCDGGLYITHDRGKNWEFIDDLPIGQFYDVGVDTRVPYRVYGGLQDNGSWGGPSRLRGSRGPKDSDWFLVGWGDGFVCRVDPHDPDQIYYEAQNGAMGRVNLRTGERGRIRPVPKPKTRYRFNWKTPYLLSHHNSKIFYAAGNHVFQSLDRGNDLRPISPEIARTKQGTATALAESPVNPDVLYVGTDDGALWSTQDGGNEWKELKVESLPGPRYVSSLTASRFKAGRAYVTFDGHRSDDDAPYVFITEDYGKSWKPIVANLPTGSARVLREDIENPNLLYLGTEFGVWASVDRGHDWTRLNNNLPTVAVHEIAVHPTAGEIVVATHGRSLWILDVSALRQITQEMLDEKVNLFAPNTAIHWGGPTGELRFGHKQFLGENPPAGAVIYYALQEKAKEISLTIEDIDNQVLAKLPVKKECGLHRSIWNLRRPARRRRPSNPPTAEDRYRARYGNRAEEGVYRVVLKVDGKTFSQKLKLTDDPLYQETTFTLEEEAIIRRIQKVQEY